MTSPALEVWLRLRFRVEAAMGIPVALLAIGLGLAVLFLTFWLAYAIVWIGEQGASAIAQLIGSGRIQISHPWRLGTAAAFMILLFMNHLRGLPWERGDYWESSSRSAFLGAFAVGAGAVGSLLCLLRYPQASSRMIVEILETGPRCLTGAWEMLRRTAAILRMDIGGCATALAVLLASPGVVPRETLAGYLPAGHLMSIVEEQLKLLEGVVCLARGLSLTDDLRAELSHHVHAPV